MGATGWIRAAAIAAAPVLVGVLVGVLVAGRTADEPGPVGPGPGGASPTTGPSTGPATMANVLGEGPLDTGALPDDLYRTDVVIVREALLRSVREAGGVRATVGGASYDVAIDLVPGGRRAMSGLARRFTWSEGGSERVQLELPGGRACVNRALGRAIERQGSTAQGWIESGEAPYSCTGPRDALGRFVTSGPATFDPLTRLMLLQGVTRLSDLGVDEGGTGVDGTRTRHLRVHGRETAVPTREVATVLDLWVDADLRLVRARFTSLEQGAPMLDATFVYGDVAPLAPVELPPEGQRDTMVLHQGLGPGTVHPPTTG